MKKDVLTLLGCSGSLAATLLAAHTASANTLTASPREFVFTAPQAANGEMIESTLPENDFSDCSCGTDAQEADSIDKEGERAIALFGCDCPGHRLMVRDGVAPSP